MWVKSIYNILKIRDKTSDLVTLVRDEDLFAKVIAEVIRTNGRTDLKLKSDNGILLVVESIVIIKDIVVNDMNVRFTIETYNPKVYGTSNHYPDSRVTLLTNLVSDQLEHAVMLKANRYFN